MIVFEILTRVQISQVDVCAGELDVAESHPHPTPPGQQQAKPSCSVFSKSWLFPCASNIFLSFQIIYFFFQYIISNINFTEIQCNALTLNF